MAESTACDTSAFPERSFDPATPVALWHREHVYFRSLLHLLQQEVDRFNACERANYELMLDIITYLHEVSDQTHHRREDAAFACLAARAPELALPLARLQQEHRVIERAGRALLEKLELVLDGGFVPRWDIEVAAATYLVYYTSHIAREESQILARAAEVLTGEDWKAVAAAAPVSADPLFGARPEKRFGELRRWITLES